MADPRFAGSAIRRRQGDPSSHLGMIDEPSTDKSVDQAIKDAQKALAAVAKAQGADDKAASAKGKHYGN
jgi:hypothetical protein